MTMQIVFRADASLDIGTGHVMRCLTLADALRERGANCTFVCREHSGNLLELIRQHGFKVDGMRAAGTCSVPSVADDEPLPTHAAWLGTDWASDAEQTLALLGDTPADWLIVDHYALDVRWERRMRSTCRRLMVIDDLADRAHDCDLLLDQNLGRSAADYERLVPAECTVLVGPQYALLRPEFAGLRGYSLARRTQPELKHLLITMGGVDKDNATGMVLDALRACICALPADCRITVVMGKNAPWLKEVRDQASAMPWLTEVRVDISDMAKLMAESDLAIGAAGSTSWERCCLGLPTFVVVLADNQRSAADALVGEGSAYLLGGPTDIAVGVPAVSTSLFGAVSLKQMSLAAGNVCDGRGLERVVEYLHLGEASELAMQPACHVRPMIKQDLKQVLFWRNHPEVRRYMYTQHEISLEEHRAWFERTSRDRSHHLLIVEDVGQPLGFVHFKEIEPDKMIEWGFYAVPDAPKGTGRKIAQAALGYAFDSLGFSKICGQALDFNERSISFHRSLGFVDEGVLPEQHFDGERYHAVRYFSLLASEWRKQH